MARKGLSHLPRKKEICAALAVALTLIPSVRLPAQTQPSDGILGQIPADYEPHGELVLVSGQLEGFAEACGFGRKPDREELFAWYDHYNLARDPGRLRVIYEVGVSIGREGPCTVEHSRALTRYWDSLMSRTTAFVETYRSPRPG